MWACKYWVLCSGGAAFLSFPRKIYNKKKLKNKIYILLFTYSVTTNIKNISWETNTFKLTSLN